MCAEALQMVQQLFRSRGQRTYFDAVKQPVEEACGRRFTVRDPPQAQAANPTKQQGTLPSPAAAGNITGTNPDPYLDTAGKREQSIVRITR